MESFSLGVFKKKPPTDELPVGKIINFEKSDNINKNILSHGRIFYVLGEGLYIRQWIFQSDYNKDKFNLGFLIKPNKKFTESEVFLFYDKEKNIVKSSEDNKIKDNINIKSFKGEDLEGWYWGAEVMIFEKYYLNFISENLPQNDDFLMGNLFSNGYLKSKLFIEDVGVFKFVDW